MSDARDSFQDAKWRVVLSNVLLNLTASLATTELKASVISIPTSDEATKIVESFDDDVLQEWKNGVKKGVNEQDWEDLIHHGAYSFESGFRIRSS